jgi:hypothetical protein
VCNEADETFSAYSIKYNIAKPNCRAPIDKINTCFALRLKSVYTEDRGAAHEYHGSRSSGDAAFYMYNVVANSRTMSIL